MVYEHKVRKKLLVSFSSLLLLSLTIFYLTQFPYYIPYSPKPDPSSQEWKELEEFERQMLVDIPEDILTRQKTGVLIQSVLNNPYINIHVVYWPDHYARGYESLKHFCNGLAELETRDDASTELLNTYARMQVTDTGDRFYKDRQRLGTLEFILAQDVYLDKLSPSELRSLNRIAQAKCEEKVKRGWGPMSCYLFYNVLSKNYRDDFPVPGL